MTLCCSNPESSFGWGIVGRNAEERNIVFRDGGGGGGGSSSNKGTDGRRRTCRLQPDFARCRKSLTKCTARGACRHRRRRHSYLHLQQHPSQLRTKEALKEAIERREREREADCTKMHKAQSIFILGQTQFSFARSLARSRTPNFTSRHFCRGRFRRLALKNRELILTRGSIFRRKFNFLNMTSFFSLILN